ncbi:hypothetical protein [Oceaniovalibus sp. ACAM 378]|uniref:hypothetical protein n=1 Tax=Oceaniovalibus sp. ACAM 378 TaxID=2599923 RepID=UPI0011D31A52|nr:hypothetical protein [Oceaniovalibus sp. ACAM 378]TYB89675.1 hypothetical protein FQ320_05970 [Oceaniovalibus sp. ACAM 378]
MFMSSLHRVMKIINDGELSPRQEKKVKLPHRAVDRCANHVVVSRCARKGGELLLKGIGVELGFFGQSLAVQVALAAGYLGYCTAYAGYRRGHLARDAIFISLVFASIASVAFVLGEAWGTVAAGLVALLTSLACACLWRMVGRKVWLWQCAHPEFIARMGCTQLGTGCCNRVVP